MRVGVIGTGSMGKNHLRVADSIPHYDLCCAVDCDEKILQEACMPYQLTQSTDFQEIVNDVDSVMVSTPTNTHFSISKFFLENKKHVLLEKPMTNTLEEADHLIDLARKNNVSLAIGHLERFNPAVEHIKSMVKEPPIGKNATLVFLRLLISGIISVSPA